MLRSSLAAIFNSVQTATRCSLWSLLSSLGTNFVAMRLVPKMSDKMRWADPYDIPTIAQTSWIVCLRSPTIDSHTFAKVSAVVLVDGRPEQSSSSTFCRTSLKRLYHKKV